jgi:hypothetical protein
MMKAIRTMACAIAFAVPHIGAAQAISPVDASAAKTAPQLTYKSTFDDYKPFEDVPVADWRQLNDTVRDTAANGGGHAGHRIQDSEGKERSVAAKDGAPPAAGGQLHRGHQ